MKKMTHAFLWMAALLAVNSLTGQGNLQIPYQLHKLPNGLTVILHEDHTVPMIAVDVWYHVGSGYEKPGRTGFAHLFEHIMFEGSGNVQEGDFDNLLESVGGNNNGSTNTDRTNYYEILPSNGLDIALFLESDRLGYLLNAMSEGKVDGQRDVVKNERRQSYENRPYGLAYQTIVENLYPKDHPYHWPTIGYMDDLTAASRDDVAEFFKKFYVPNNAVLTIAGDIDPEQALERVKYWFSEIPAGNPVVKPVAPNFVLEAPKYLTMEDNVQLPRLYLVYPTPAYFTPGDAEMDVIGNILAGGTSSRLFQKLVYETGMAQNVSAYQSSQALGSMFMITVTARPGHTLEEIMNVVDGEIARLQEEAPAARELQRVINQQESQFLSESQSLLGKAEALQEYYYYTGNPDWANEDLNRFKALSVGDISAASVHYLKPKNRLVLSVVPQGQSGKLDVRR
ncbi:MAG: insulinase family protein [Haliscomenobacter sp.]|nr:insulinase family protein [Haliscomenobacter sp.]